MRRLSSLVFAAFVLLAPAFAAAAPVTFAGTFSLSGHGDDSAGVGLEIETRPGLGTAAPFSFTLDPAVAGWTRIDDPFLFRIRSTETTVNADDWTPQPFTVTFAFTAPTSFGGAVEGVTHGVNLVFVAQYGRIVFPDPVVDLAFGTGGILRLRMEAEDVFSGGLFGLSDAWTRIGARAKLVRMPTGGIGGTAVPEPGPLALLGLGLLGAVALRRR